MIIKEKSIKNYVALERVLRYVLSKESSDGFVHTRLITGDRKFKKELESSTDTESQSIIQENRLQNMLRVYKNNDSRRKVKRKGERKFTHSILSFHKDDNLSEKDLLRVSKQFIKERYPKCIVCSVSHHDKHHLHLHLIGSHVKISGDTNYYARSEFSKMKQRMEDWQEKELDLTHSKVQHVKKKEQSLVKDAEYQLSLRGELSEKQQLQMILQQSYNKASSIKQFYGFLEKEGLTLYVHGKNIGIKAKRKYRLQTLGFSKERISLLELTKQKRQKQLSRLVQLKQREKDNDLEQER